MKPRMSFFVTRPLMPVPLICRMSTLCSFAIRRTSGDDLRRRNSSIDPASAADAAAAGASLSGWAAAATGCSGVGSTGPVSG